MHPPLPLRLHNNVRAQWKCTINVVKNDDTEDRNKKTTSIANISHLPFGCGLNSQLMIRSCKLKLSRSFINTLQTFPNTSHRRLMLSLYVMEYSNRHVFGVIQFQLFDSFRLDVPLFDRFSCFWHSQKPLLPNGTPNLLVCENGNACVCESWRFTVSPPQYVFIFFFGNAFSSAIKFFVAIKTSFLFTAAHSNDVCVVTQHFAPHFITVMLTKYVPWFTWECFHWKKKTKLFKSEEKKEKHMKNKLEIQEKNHRFCFSFVLRKVSELLCVAWFWW